MVTRPFFEVSRQFTINPRYTHLPDGLLKGLLSSNRSANDLQTQRPRITALYGTTERRAFPDSSAIQRLENGGKRQLFRRSGRRVDQ